MNVIGSMEFITSLNDRDTDLRVLRLVQLIHAETVTIVDRIRSEGRNEAITIHRVMLTEGYREVDLLYEAKERSLLKNKLSMTKAMSLDSRWKILTAEMDSAKSTIAVARKRLNVLQASGNEFYVSVLKALTLQAICRLLEPHAWLVLRHEDVRLIEPLLPEIVAEYARLAGGGVRIVVDPGARLPDSSIGGVLAADWDRKVFVDNTLAIRFRRSTDTRLPLLYGRLFGKRDVARGGGGEGSRSSLTAQNCPN